MVTREAFKAYAEVAAILQVIENSFMFDGTHDEIKTICKENNWKRPSDKEYFNLWYEAMDLLTVVADCIAEFYGKPLLSEGPKIMITSKDAKKIRTVLKKGFKKKR